MKIAFDKLISRSDMTEERISELENITIETSITEKQREKSLRYFWFLTWESDLSFILGPLVALTG